MMEKMPVSARRGRRRGEIRWMPEKARGCKGTSGAEAVALSALCGAAEIVADGFWVAVIGGAQSGVTVLLARARSWLWLSKRSWREEGRDWTARVARARWSLWNWSIWEKSMVLRTSTLWRRKGSSRFFGSSRKNQEAFFRPPPVSRRISSREISMRRLKLFLDFRYLMTMSAWWWTLMMTSVTPKVRRRVR